MNEKSKPTGRRDFLKKSAIGAAGLTMGMPAVSYARIIGSNERINTAIIGCYRRFPALANPLTNFDDVLISYVCDVDSRRQENAKVETQKKVKNKIKG